MIQLGWLRIFVLIPAPHSSFLLFQRRLTGITAHIPAPIPVLVRFKLKKLEYPCINRSKLRQLRQS